VKGYGFVEFETADDARAAHDEMNGAEFGGETMTVEFATEKPPRVPGGPPRERGERGERGPPHAQFSQPREAAFRVNVSNLSSSTSWQVCIMLNSD
jgi:RNA recognition motif-containing protein